MSFGLLCAGLALLLVAWFLLETDRAYEDLFTWAGLGCLIVGNIAIAVLRARDPEQR